MIIVANKFEKFQAVILCIVLLVPLFSPAATCWGQNILAPKNNRNNSITVQIGQPTVWSMGQAHYLLAKMRSDNFDLVPKQLSSEELDPNKANGTRMQLLKTLLDVEAQYSQKVGLENSINSSELQQQVSRRNSAQLLLPQKKNQLEALTDEINKKSILLAELKKRQEQAKDPEREIQIARLEVEIKQKEAEKTSLTKEVESLGTAANSTITPNLTEVATSTTRNMLTDSKAMTEFIEKAFADTGKANLSAQIALDNYVNFQYEMLAKQLTLLRDETGSEERIIFVELPTAIYTASDKGNNQMVQVEWEVDNYFYFDEVRESELNNINACEVYKFEPLEKAKDDTDKTNKKDPQLRAKKEFKSLATINKINSQNNSFTSQYFKAEKVLNPKDNTKRDKVTVIVKKSVQGRCDSENKATSPSVRTLDIIPRQSALNVNEYYGTQKRWNFLFGMKLLSGFGLKLDYQRQKELYEQFLQQDIYASGYGKGSNLFGWTFGPTPGTRRISPGIKNTYAVLVVPRKTSAISFKVRGYSFKNKEVVNRSEDNNKHKIFEMDQEQLIVRVPNEDLEDFEVEDLQFSPVNKGDRVTVRLTGDYFSPQIGVLVDGVPLKRALSLSNKEVLNAKNKGTTLANFNVDGEFELLNSHEIVMSFSMGKDFVGTPRIHLSTPEKTVEINYFELDINKHKNVSLHELATTVPMFMDEFSITKDLFNVTEDPSNSNYLTARIKGTGLSSDAVIMVNNSKLERKEFSKEPSKEPSKESSKESSKELQTNNNYLITFPKNEDGSNKYTIRIGQRTKLGFKEEEFVYEKKTSDPVKTTVLRYIPELIENGRKYAIADVRFSYTGEKLTPTILANYSEFLSIDRTKPPVEEGTGKLLVRLKINYEQINDALFLERKVIPVQYELQQKEGAKTKDTIDITLPLRPQITAIKNPRTKQAIGYADEEPMIVIEGTNLSNIKSIYFGEIKLDVTSGPNNIIVKVPKWDKVPKGQEVQIPVKFETDQVLEGNKISTLSYYTFLGEPLAPTVVEGKPYPVYLPYPSTQRKVKRYKKLAYMKQN